MTPDVAAWLQRHKPTKCPDAFGMQTLDDQRKTRPMWRGGKASEADLLHYIDQIDHHRLQYAPRTATAAVYGASHPHAQLDLTQTTQLIRALTRPPSTAAPARSKVTFCPAAHHPHHPHTAQTPNRSKSHDTCRLHR